jgi:hypothetical protein
VTKIGNIIAISISNIKKMIATIKKWMEKEIRGDVKFLNPHSKADVLFKSRIDFLDSKKDKVVSKVRIIRAIIILCDILIFSLKVNLLIGS